MNPEKLKALQAQVRIGGKGSARRKKKVVHRTATTDDKKLQSSLKKLAVNNIPGIEEVNMIKEDGQVIHFNNPKVQASLAANTFAITGHAETKPVWDMMPGLMHQMDVNDLLKFGQKPMGDGSSEITEMLPGILNQLGAESLANLKKLATSVSSGVPIDGDKPPTGDIDEDDDDVPDLVENFDEASKGEGV